jgi:hypothetical protein
VDLRRSARIAVPALCAASLAATASAQSIRPGGIHFLDWDPRLRLGFEWRDESRSTEFNQLEQRERTFREDFLLRTRGYAYHPRLVDFTASGAIGLEQTDVETTGDVTQRSVDGRNLAYDVRTRWFKEHPYTATLYGVRNEVRARQTLFRTTEALVTEAGAEVAAKELWIPSRVSVRDYDYDGRGADTNEEHRSGAEIEGTRSVDGSLYQYALRYNDIDLASSNRRFEDAEAYVSGSWRLGRTDDDRFSTSVRQRTQDGDIDTSSMQASTALDLALTNTVQSTTRAERLEFSSDGSGANDTSRIESTATHRLYDSLVSQVGANALRNEFEGGQIDRYGGNVDLRYRKDVGFGKLELGYRIDSYLQDEQSSSGPVLVLDEAKVASVGTPIVLDNFGADPTTVVITDATGLILYLDPQDYTLSAVQGRVEISISLGGNIVPGQTILVDYSYLPRPPVRFVNNGQGFRAALRIQEWLGLEFGLLDRKQTLESGIDTGTLNNEHAILGAIDVGDRDRSLRAEYEDRDATFASYERVEYTGSLRLPAPDPMQWQVSASTFATRFKDDSRTERGDSVQSTLDSSIGPGTHASLRAEYRRLDLRTDEGNGWLVEAMLTHEFRRTTIDLRMSIGEERFVVASDQTHFQVWLYLTRSF